jgi:hypothetical protein
MALKKSEKLLVGYGLLGSGVVLFIFLGMPQLDAYNASRAQVETLERELADVNLQKTNLQQEITLLEHNTAIPPGIEIKTYTPATKEQVVKQMLDMVVSMAVDADNKFISLAPVDAEPILAPAKADDKDKDGNKAEGDASGGQQTANGEKAPPPPPMLTTFGYELAIRGTYDSIQTFLKRMAQQKELMEINEISLENELTNDQNVGADKIVDAKYPIRLTAKLRLALQPVNE